VHVVEVDSSQNCSILHRFCLLKNPAKTSLGWLAGLSWFKLEVAGFSWSPNLA